jgi:hypothetical protein
MRSSFSQSSIRAKRQRFRRNRGTQSANPDEFHVVTGDVDEVPKLIGAAAGRSRLARQRDARDWRGSGTLAIGAAAGRSRLAPCGIPSADIRRLTNFCRSYKRTGDSLDLPAWLNTPCPQSKVAGMLHEIFGVIGRYGGCQLPGEAQGLKAIPARAVHLALQSGHSLRATANLGNGDAPT